MADNFLIVTDSYRDGLYQFDMTSKTVWRIPFSHHGYGTGLAYDHTNMQIYWTSTDELAIKRANLTGMADGTLSSLRERMYYIPFSLSTYTIFNCETCMTIAIIITHNN